ncbi:Elf1-domain-containing protein, partial [Saccharata proteae CBS 121410]
RKKSSKKPQGPKKREPLATSFQCLFCNHENSVGVKLEKKAGVGNLLCKVCGQAYQTPITYLSAPVDVYYDWVDACEAVANEAHDGAGNRATDPYREQDHVPSKHAATADRRNSGGGYEADDFVEDDEADAEGDFADD